MKKVLVVVFAWFFSGLSFACELTEEYKEARNYIVEQTRKPYSECTGSVASAKYWYRYVQCEEAGDGEGIGGGCAHVAGLGINRYENLKIDDKFCSPLKLTIDERKKILNLYVEEQQIVKCK